MKLEKLHVTDLGARQASHRDAVAGGHFRICCAGVQLARASGCQHDGAAKDLEHFERAQVDVLDASAPLILNGLDDKASSRGMGKELDIWLEMRARQQCAHDLAASRIAVGVQHPAPRVGGFAREDQAIVDPIELRSPFDEFRDVLPALFNQDGHGRFVAQSGARLDRVVAMKRHFILFAQSDGDAALGPFAVRFAEAVFRQDDHGPCGSKSDRGTKSGDTAADHDKIWVLVHCAGNSNNPAVAEQRSACPRSLRRVESPLRSDFYNKKMTTSALIDAGAPKRFVIGEGIAGLGETLAAIDGAKYRPAQLFRAIYQRRIDSFEQATELPLALRRALDEQCQLNPVAIRRVLRSSDGTRKYLGDLADGRSIECVWMPEQRRDTICISTQAGCPLGCSFCMTALMGLERNLSSGEMAGQVIAVLNDVYGAGQQPEHGVNVVLMGMGEPLLNYENVLAAVRLMADASGLAISPRRITLSTAGIVPKIAELGKETVRPKLAISLSATTDEIRDQLMPINKRYPLSVLLEACRAFPLKPRERITFEYVLLEGVNDSPQDARWLIKLLHGIKAKVNLIAHNSTSELPYRASGEERVLAFQRIVLDAGYSAFIRTPRGRDILAACGQLRAREVAANDSSEM